MPVDYQQGKIYKLYIGDLLYIGSTAQPRLSLRLGQHKSKYNHWVKTGEKYYSSFELFKIGVPTIELVELFPCGSKDELRAREGCHQRANNCVNKIIAGRSQAEYYEENRQQLAKTMKVYYEANRQHISEQHKQYRDANAQQIGDQLKVYYVANKQRICDRMRVYRAAIRRTERLTLFIQKHVQSI